MSRSNDNEMDLQRLREEVEELRQQLAELQRAEVERQMALEALRQSEERYRAILEGIEDAYIENDLRDLTFFNDAFCRITGYSREELMGVSYRTYMDEANAQRVYEAYNRVYRTGEPVKEFGYELIAKDGTRKYIDISISLIRDAAGQPIGFRSIARDRTESKKTEEALRQSEESYRHVLTVSPHAITISSWEDGRYLQVNDAFCRRTGYSREEAIGKTSIELNIFVDPHDRVRLLDAVRGGQADGLEMRFRSKDGTIHYNIVSARLIHFEGEDCLLVVATNIDRLKETHEALQESERKYRTILESMEEGYYEADLKGNILFCNDALCRIHGRSRKELVGLNYKKYTTAQTAKRIYKIFNTIYRTGVPAKIIDYEIIRKDGSIAIVEESASLLRNAAGEPIGFFGVSRDRTEQKRAEEELRRSEERYRTILDEIEEGYYEVDLAGNFTYFNDSLCRIHGYPPEELMGMNNRAYMDKETAKVVFQVFNAVFRTGKGTTATDWQIIRKDGTRRYVEASIALIRDKEGRPIGFRGLVRDVTERKKAEEALRLSQERYRALVEFTDDSVYLVNREKEYLFANAAYLLRVGVPKEFLIGKRYGDFHPPEDAAEFSNLIDQVFATRRFIQHEHKSHRDDRYFLRTLSPVLNQKGEVEAVTVIAKDITERKRAEEELVYLATHDPLTGLPNRTLFNDRLGVALRQAVRGGTSLAVMLLDLDNFKVINDTLGHSAGDQLLVVVGKRLEGLLRTSDTVARLGGDEFLLLLPDISGVEDAEVIARKVLGAFRRPFVFGEHTLSVTASIGVAVYPEGGEDGESLVKNADIAMYRAKDGGRDRFVVYRP